MAIFLCSWNLGAQCIQLQCDVPVFIAVGGHKSSEAKMSWKMNMLGNVNLTVFSADSVIYDGVLNLRTQGNEQQKWTYVLEKNALGKYSIFNRKLNIGQDQTCETPLDWPLDDGSVLIVTGYAPKERSSTPLSPSPSLSPDTTGTDTTITLTTAQLNETTGEIDSIPSFSVVMMEFRNINFEFDRLQSINDWARENNPTVYQIQQLGTLAKYDHTRFMLYQSVYDSCSEKQEYWKLMETFEYKSTQDQFSNWLTETEL